MDYVKKYWFVALIAILFSIAIGYFAVSESNAKFKGKQVNGQDVVFEYNGKNVTADDLYDDMFETVAPSLGLRYVQMGMYRYAYEPSEELVAEAEEYYQNTITNYRGYYGENYEEYLLSDLYSLGYTKIEDLKEYFIASLMATELEDNYLADHQDELYGAYAEAKHPRILEHILVKMEDAENPSEEELAKVAAIEEALASGQSFEEVAKAYSDDSSAESGGYLGFSDDDTSYVTEFLAAAKALSEGEVTSEWVVHTSTSSTGYNGWHLIKCVSTSYEDFKDDETFLANWADYSDVTTLVFKEVYANTNIDFHGNDIIKEFIEEQIGSSEEE